MECSDIVVAHPQRYTQEGHGYGPLLCTMWCETGPAAILVLKAIAANPATSDISGKDKHSGALTYEHPHMQSFLVTTSSGLKILLQLATGASSYYQKNAGEKVGNSNC